MAGKIAFKQLEQDGAVTGHAPAWDSKLSIWKSEPHPRGNVLVDGDMEFSDTTAWSVANNATLSKETGTSKQGTQVLRIAYNDTANPYATQDLTSWPAGSYAQIEGYARGDGTYAPQVRVWAGTQEIVWHGNPSTSWQAINACVAVGGGTVGVGFGSDASASGYAEFDALTVVRTSPPAWPLHNLLYDGDFEEDDVSAEWTALNNATLSKQGSAAYGSKCLRVAYSDTSNPAATQSINPSPFDLARGATVHISGLARGDGTYAPLVNIDILGGEVWRGTSSTSWQRFDILVDGFYTQSYIILRLYSTATGVGYAEFDQVRAVIAPPRDTTFRNLIRDGDMEEPGAGAWTVVNSATLTKQTGTPQEGAQCLRIAHNGSDNPGARQVLTMPARAKLRFTGYARGDATRWPFVYVYSDQTTAQVWTGDAVNTWQYFDFEVTVGGTTTIDFHCSTTVAGYAEFDAVAITSTPFVEVPYENLLTDGDMEDVYTGAWTVVSNATITKQTASPKYGNRNLRVAYSDTSWPAASQTIATPTNAVLRISGYARGDGTYYPRVDGNLSSVIWTGTTSTSWQRFDVLVTAGDTVISLYASATGAGYAEFDYVKITAVVPITSAVSPGYAPQCNFSATTDPTANDDSGDGYTVGSLWVNVSTDDVFVCVDNTSTAAIWDLVNSPKSNFAATVDPTANEDSADGYSVGSVWVNVTDDVAFICADATATAAVWIRVVGNTATSSTDHTIVRFDGTTGQKVQGSGVVLDDNGKLDEVDQLSYIGEHDHGTQTTSYTMDLGLSQCHKMTLGGNTAITFTAPNGPCSLKLKLVQDGTGGRNPTWSSSPDWAGGTAPDYSTQTTGGEVNLLWIYYDGTGYYMGLANDPSAPFS